MDLLNMPNRAQFREFYKKVKLRKLSSFKPGFSNLGSNLQYVIYDQIQNFSSISLTLCLLGQKKTQGYGVCI